MKILGTMNMFGQTVQFCDCEICKAFLGMEMEDSPVNVGTVESDPTMSVEDIVDGLSE